MTLIDMDDVCTSNINRQLCAVSSSVGKFKAEVLRNRVLDINPHADVTVILGDTSLFYIYFWLFVHRNVS